MRQRSRQIIKYYFSYHLTYLIFKEKKVKIKKDLTEKKKTIWWYVC